MNQEIDPAKLRQILCERFSLSELKTLCVDLSIDHESLEGGTISDKARELIDYMRRRDRLPDLVKAIQNERPTIEVLQSEREDAAPLYTNSPKGISRSTLVDDYISKIAPLLRQNDDTSHKLIRYIVFTACRELSGDEKAQFLQFLYGATLIDIEDPIIDMHGVDLSDIDLHGVTLTKAMLAGSKIRRSNLKSVDLTEADLSEVDLTDSNLDDAILRYTALHGANLRRTSLQGADLEGAVKRVGYVMAGESLTREDEEDNVSFNELPEEELIEGEIYYFEVKGVSMEQKDIFEGDRVIIKASNSSPNEGEIIVTRYLPADTPIIIGEEEPKFRELSGPTIKVFLGREEEGKPYRLQGWTTKRQLKATAIMPIGIVATVCRSTAKRRKIHKRREWSNLT